MDKLTVFGITLNARLTATDHVSGLLSSCSSLLYMLRILRSHGLSDMSLQDVFRATVLAKLTYRSPAWSGYCTAADLGLTVFCADVGDKVTVKRVNLNCLVTSTTHF